MIVWESAREGSDGPQLSTRACACRSVTIATPRLPDALSPGERNEDLAALLDQLLLSLGGGRAVLWYRSPRVLPFTRALEAAAVVYDRVEELSMLEDPELAALDRELMARADAVFFGGYGLYRQPAAAAAVWREPYAAPAVERPLR